MLTVCCICTYAWLVPNTTQKNLRYTFLCMDPRGSKHGACADGVYHPLFSPVQIKKGPGDETNNEITDADAFSDTLATLSFQIVTISVNV